MGADGARSRCGGDHRGGTPAIRPWMSSMQEGEAVFDMLIVDDTTLSDHTRQL
jgi:hypothetical protein